MAKTACGFEIMEDYGGVGNLPSVPTGPVIDQDGVSAMLPSQDVSPSRGSLEMASRPATLQEAETIRRLTWRVRGRRQAQAVCRGRVHRQRARADGAHGGWRRAYRPRT